MLGGLFMSKRFLKHMLAFMTVMVMMIASVMPVYATDTGAMATTEDPADGILQVWLEYVNDNGQKTRLFGGTCFLINEEYVLSNYHIFDLDEPSGSGVTRREAIMQMMGLDKLTNSDPHLRIFVYANRDMSVEAAIHESVQSETMDFVALRLSEKIYDRAPLVIGNSNEVQQKDTVYALGFPSDSIENKEFNTKADVSFSQGIISKVTVREKADVFEHTAQLNSGNSGGPLLNEANEVIGINTFSYGNETGSKYYSVQIDAIRSALDTFGIRYTGADGFGGGTTGGNGTVGGDGNNGNGTTGGEGETGGDVDVTGPSEEEAQIASLRTSLEDELERAKNIDTEGYTEESVEVLDDMIGTAESVSNNSGSSASEIQEAIDDLKAAIDDLEEESEPNMILIVGGVAGAAAIVIIIVVVVIASGGKKKKKATSGVYTPGASAGSPAGRPPVAPVNQPVNSPVPPQVNQPQGGIPEGAGETTLLDSGAGETTLLGGGGSAGGAYLIRKKNGEKIAISSQSFSIGKERRRVNYCISDNTSVSRYHVVITKKGADYYAADQKSSNFTFVNGVQLSPYQDTLLTDKSTLKVSDEEFEFHLS